MSKRTNTLTALAAATLALAAAPSAAQAETVKITRYELTFDLRLDHQHVTNFSAPQQSSHTKLDSSTRLLGKMDVAFANGRVQATSNGMARGFTTAEWTAELSDAGGRGNGHCTATPGLPVEWGAPTIGEPILTPLGDPEIDLRFSESSKISWDSCSGNLGSSAYPDLGDPSKQLGEGPLDAVFTMPTSAIGNGKIIQLVSGPPTGSASFCPGNEDQTTTSCTYGWNGTVTLTKTSETTISDGATTPPKAAGRQTGSSGRGPAGTKKASVSTKAKADAKGRTVTFDADCPLGCAGIAHLNFGTGKASVAAKAARGIRFTVKPGRRTVTLTIPASQRRKLRRARRATLTVALTPKGGPRMTRVLRVSVAKRR